MDSQASDLNLCVDVLGLSARFNMAESPPAAPDTPLLASRRPPTRLHPQWVTPPGSTFAPSSQPAFKDSSEALVQPDWPLPLSRCTSTPISQSELRTLLDFDEITVQPRATPTSSSASESGYESWGRWSGLDTPPSRQNAPPAPPRVVKIRDLCSWDATASLEITADSIITRKRSNYTPGYFLHKDHVDFLRHLFDRNMYEALRISFSYLDARSLCQIAQVSGAWREALYSDFEAVRRKDEFLRQQKWNLVRPNWCPK